MPSEREKAPEQTAVIISRRDLDAAIFSLDGVLTDTPRVHAAAWKEVSIISSTGVPSARVPDLQPFESAATFLPTSTGDLAMTASAPFSRRGA